MSHKVIDGTVRCTHVGITLCNHSCCKEVLQLREELAKYKPPEPKFAVGQIVVCLIGDGTRITPVAIKHREYLPDKIWWYTSWYSGQKFKESELRIQTPEERGNP